MMKMFLLFQEALRECTIKYALLTINIPSKTVPKRLLDGKGSSGLDDSALATIQSKQGQGVEEGNDISDEDLAAVFGLANNCANANDEVSNGELQSGGGEEEVLRSQYSDGDDPGILFHVI